MPHYKDLNNKPHFLDDASFVHLLPSGCVEITPEEAIALVAPNFDQLKETKKSEIRSAFDADANAAVVVGGLSFQGGFESAIKLDAAKRLAEAAAFADVTFFDASNTARLLSFADANVVILAVAGAYQIKFAKKQAAMVAAELAETEAQLAQVSY